MNNQRQAIIKEARRWIGTPFRHQASLRGIGCDCAGLIKGVGMARNLVSLDENEWRAVSSYGRQPRPDRMGAVLKRFLVQIEPGDALAGDIVWMEWRKGLPMHLALLSEFNSRPTIIHAFSDFSAVVEHGYNKEWSDKAMAWWRYPGLVK